ncbi:stimulated by retinoic acid gene 6 protein-like [Glandiceps talaboti]
MIILLRGLKTYLLDFFFVMLLYTMAAGIIDILTTFHAIMVDALTDIRCLMNKKFRKLERCKSITNESRFENIIDEYDFELSYSDDWSSDYSHGNDFTYTGSLPDSNSYSTSVTLQSVKAVSNTEVTTSGMIPTTVNSPASNRPVNLMDDHSNRIGFLAAFGTTASNVLDLFTGNFAISFSDLGREAAVFAGAVNVFVLVLQFYPVFACISAEDKLAGSLLGFIYLIYTTSVLVAEACLCHPTPFTVFIGWIASVDWILRIILVVNFGVVLVQELLKVGITGRKTPNKQLAIRNMPFGIYVKALLRKRHEKAPTTTTTTTTTTNGQEISMSVWHRMSRSVRFFYKPVPGFKYSTHILATFVVASVTLYKVSVTEIMWLSGMNNDFYLIIEMFMEFFFSNSKDDQTFVKWRKIGDLLVPFALFSVSLTMAVIAYFIYSSLVTYRKHLIRMFQGDKSFLPEVPGAAPNLLTRSFKYSGYQIGFLLWSFVTLQICFIFTMLMVLYEVVLPLGFEKKESFFYDKIHIIWPSGVFGLILHLFQLFLSRYAFLQGEAKHLNVDNRRMLHATSLFMFYFNVLLGLFTSMARLLRSLLFGLLFLGRLDRSVLQRDVEMLDPGYRAYVGFLIVEEAHCHPVVVTFVHLLIDSLKTKTGQGEVQ